MTLLRKKKLLPVLSLLIGLLLIIALLASGCTRGMSAVGWSGVLIGDDGVAYTGSKEGRLVSVDLNNSLKQYAEALRASSAGTGSCSFFGSGSGGGGCGGAAPSVAIYGTPATATVPVLGKLIYLAGYNGKVFAYDAVSLQSRWVYPVDAYISPIVSGIVVDGDSLYFGCTDGAVYSLDTATGAMKWRVETEGEVWSTPAISNGILVVGSFDKKIYGLNAQTGEIIWTYTGGANFTSTALIEDGMVYMGALDSTLYALDLADGREVWTYKADHWFWARPVIANGILFAPCQDRNVYALDPETGANVAQYDLGGQISSWPVVIGSKVVVATQNKTLWYIDSSDTSLEAKKIADIAENVTSPLGVSGDFVYINTPDDKLIGYNVETGAQKIAVSLSKE